MIRLLLLSAIIISALIAGVDCMRAMHTNIIPYFYYLFSLFRYELDIYLIVLLIKLNFKWTRQEPDWSSQSNSLVLTFVGWIIFFLAPYICEHLKPDPWRRQIYDTRFMDEYNTIYHSCIPIKNKTIFLGIVNHINWNCLIF